MPLLTVYLGHISAVTEGKGKGCQFV